MYKIVNDFPNELFNAEEGPFISLYQPTHRHSPENQQDPIRFKNLVREIEVSLKEKYPKKEIKPIMDTFIRLSEDKEFWNYTNEGLAVLYAEGQAIIYKLNRTVKELVVVGENFHIKPLIRNFQSADRYHALGLNREGFTIFEGNRYGFDEVDLDADIPRNIREALGDQFTSSYLTVGRYAGAGVGGVFHGHGSRKDEIEKDTERFFRFVDKVVLDHYSRPMELPLVLVALPEYHTLFKNISHNPYLLEKGVGVNYDILTVDKLKDRIWEVIEPIYLKKTSDLVDRFGEAQAQDLGSDDKVQIAKASVENRIETLLLESDKIVPGRLNKETGQIEEGELIDPEIGDLLNDIAETTLKFGGEVVILPKERMPTDRGAAAIYRY